MFAVVSKSRQRRRLRVGLVRDLLERLTFGLRLGLDFALRATRSGSFAPPVSRFHSSKVPGEISPLMSSSANFLRCAWLLKGMATTYTFGRR